MTGHQLKHYRKKKGLTQAGVAQTLGVSQPYLSLLENSERPLTKRLKKKVVGVFELPSTELPSNVSVYKVTNVSDDQLTADLAALGYEGFSHWKPSRRKNPADVLLSTLNAEKRDARLVEALPWLVLAFPDMDWDSLVATAKVNDLQNRLGFVVNVARHVVEKWDGGTAVKLRAREAELERSMLAREDTLCNETMTNAEKKWLKVQRSAAAKHWHLLTDLSPRHLRYYVR